jgi:hypothetical protein
VPTAEGKELVHKVRTDAKEFSEGRANLFGRSAIFVRKIPGFCSDGTKVQGGPGLFGRRLPMLRICIGCQPDGPLGHFEVCNFD